MFFPQRCKVCLRAIPVSETSRLCTACRSRFSPSKAKLTLRRIMSGKILQNPGLNILAGWQFSIKRRPFIQISLRTNWINQKLYPPPLMKAFLNIVFGCSPPPKFNGFNIWIVQPIKERGARLVIKYFYTVPPKPPQADFVLQLFCLQSTTISKSDNLRRSTMCSLKFSLLNQQIKRTF